MKIIMKIIINNNEMIIIMKNENVNNNENVKWKNVMIIMNMK